MATCSISVSDIAHTASASSPTARTSFCLSRISGSYTANATRTGSIVSHCSADTASTASGLAVPVFGE